MKTKKLLSLLLALMMMLSVVPMYASAADPIALTEANVTVWPTASGEIYFGQKISDGITLSGGEVQYNGAVVAGHFEFIDPDLRPTSAGNQIAAIKFIPNDTSAYTGFEVAYAWDVTFKVNKTTPVFVDENDTVPVATEVEAGAALSTSTLSGAKVKNPYNESESKALAAKWRWTKTSTIVNESGYYQARMVIGTTYEVIYTDVYVKIAGETPETTIAEYPTIPELTYNPDVTWADIELTGGKAVIKGTETEVEGTFAIKETRLNVAPNPNFTEIEVVFTPDDPEAALPYEFTIPVKVNSAHISFVDGEGNAVVEGFEFEVEPGTKMGDVRALLNAVLRIPANSVTSVEDSNSYAQNGRTYKLTVLYDENVNYTGKELYFTVKFKNFELTPTITAIGLNKFKVNCGDYSPAGTFTITCNGEEVTVTKANQDFACEVWTDNGGTYEIKAKYNPAENDYFIISDAEWAITVYAKRNLKASAMTYTVNGDAYAKEIRANDIIVAKTSYEDFAHYVIKDGSGKEIVLEGVDITSREITFAMPDHDLTIEIKTNKQIEMEEAAANCDHICHSDNPLFQMLWKVLTFIFRLFDVQQYCDCGNLHYDAPLFG